MDKPNQPTPVNNHHTPHRTLLNLFFLCIFLLIITLNVRSYYQVLRLSAANQLVIHTYQVMEATHNSLLKMIDIESLLRTYLVTHDKSFIKNLNEKINNAYYHLGLAKQLTMNDNQRKNLIDLKGLFNKQINMIKKTILFKKNHQIETPTQLTLLYNAQKISAQIKVLLLTINEKEFDLLKQRDTITLNNLYRTSTFIISANIITLFIIFTGLLMLNCQLSRRIFTEHKLRKSEALLKSIIHGSNDFIAALDPDYRFILFNRSYKDEFNRIFGKKIVLGMSIKDALAHLPEEQKKAVAIWNRSLNGEEFITISEFGDKKLDQLPYEINVSSIRDNHGNLIGASHIARNIKKRIEAEKAILAANEKLTLAYQELKAHDEGVSLLNQMDTLLQTCVTVDEALELIINYCKKLLPFAAGTIYLNHSSGNYLVASAHWNTSQNTQQTISADQCWALWQGKPYKFLNQKNNICCKHYVASNQLQLCFCIPLIAQKDNIGLLYIEIKKTNHQTKEQLIQTASGYELIVNNLGTLIALSIANIRLKNRLRISSIRDPLTKLYNRNYLNESLKREIHRAKRNNTKLAIIMIDIDHFKNINDAFGHQAGDLVLQTIGNLLLKQVRKSDLACRYGGEEFLLMLYGASVNDAIERAETMKKKLSNIKFHFANQTINSINASFGIAIYPEQGENMEKLIKTADQALYESKKTGRNKVTVFGSFKPFVGHCHSRAGGNP